MGNCCLEGREVKSFNAIARGEGLWLTWIVCSIICKFYLFFTFTYYYSDRISIWSPSLLAHYSILISHTRSFVCLFYWKSALIRCLHIIGKIFMFIYRPGKKPSIKERNVLIIFKLKLKIYIEQQNNEK